jgi:hypothetical protein
MSILNAFIDAKAALDKNPVVKSPDWAEDWSGVQMPSGFVVRDALLKDSLHAFLARCPLPVPSSLQQVWLEANGFAGQWDCEYTASSGQKSTHNLAFGLLPAVEAFGGERHIADTTRRTGSDALLQGPILDPERFELCAEFGYEDASKMAFEPLLKNAILLECFSPDLQYYTLLKLDATDGSPELYLSYEHGLYPLSLRLDDYFEVMFQMMGRCWPWPLLFVDAHNASAQMQHTLNDARERAERVEAALKSG